METKKSIFASKTFWANALTVLIGILATIGDMVPPEALQYILLFSGVLNVILRSITSKPVGLVWLALIGAFYISLLTTGIGGAEVYTASIFCFFIPTGIQKSQSRKTPSEEAIEEWRERTTNS